MKTIRLIFIFSLALLFSPGAFSQTVWTLRNIEGLNFPLVASAGTGNQIVVLGDSSKYYTSVDGIKWTRRVMDSAKNHWSIIWAGTQFVATGRDSLGNGIVLTSANGTSWTKRRLDTPSVIKKIIWTGDQLVAVDSTGRFLTSPDGITWVGKKVIDSLDNIQALVWAGSQIVAFGNQYRNGSRSGIVFTSPDGKIWKRSSAIKTTGFSHFTWTGNQIVGFTSDSTITSPDGINWTSSGSNMIYSFSSVVWVDTQFVALGYTTTSSSQGRFCKVYTSRDGMYWTERFTGLFEHSYYSAPDRYFSAFMTWTGNQFIAIGSNGGAISSPNGITWTSIKIGEHAPILNSVASSGFQDLAVGTGGAIMASSDKITWIRRSSGTPHSLNCIIWTGSQFVAVGDSGTIIFSADGITWTTRNTGTVKALRAIVWAKAHFIAAGDSGTILTSPDGNSWTARNSGSLGTIDAMAANDTLIVGVGNMGIWRSPDGINWTGGLGNINLNSIIWTGHQFVAVGSKGAILTSPNGSNFVKHTSGGNEAYHSFHSVIWTGNTFLALDLNYASHAISKDGLRWVTTKQYPIPAGINRIALSGNQIIGVGTYGRIFTSPVDGPTEIISQVPVQKGLYIRITPIHLSFSLPSDMLDEKLKVSIYSTTGAKVQDAIGVETNGDLIVPISKITTGRYLLEVKGSKRRIVKSFFRF